MKLFAIFTCVGFICGFIGTFTLYLFLKSINDGSNYIYLIISLVFITASIICLYKAANPKKPKSTLLINSDDIVEKTAIAIGKNNSTVAAWDKTNETRDRLKLLKMAGAAEEEKVPE